MNSNNTKNLEVLNKMLSRGKEFDTLCEKIFNENVL